MGHFYDPHKHGPQQGEGKFEVDSRIKFQMDLHNARIKQGLPIVRSRFGQRNARLQYLTQRKRVITDLKALTRKRRFERTIVGRFWLALTQFVHGGERE